MESKKTFNCFICPKENLVNLRSHVRYAHGMTLSEAQSQHETGAKFVVKNTDAQCITNTSNYSDPTSEGNGKDLKQENNNYLMISKYRSNPTEYLPNLRAFARLRTSKKQKYLKYRAKSLFIRFLRDLICNILKKNIKVNLSKLKMCRCEYELSKIIDSRNTHEQARRYLSSNKMIKFLDFVVHPAIEYLGRPLHILPKEEQNPLDTFV